MTRISVLRRAVTVLMAVSLAVTSTCVSALAETVPVDQINIQLSAVTDDNGLNIILPEPERELLAEAVYTDCTAAERAAIAKGDILTVTLSAGKLSGVRAADQTLLDGSLAEGEKPVLVVELRLQKQLPGGEPVAIKSLETSVEVTLVLPEELVDSSVRYVAVWIRDAVTTTGITHNLAPNTLVLSMETPGEFVIVPETSLAIKPPVHAPQSEPVPVSKPVPLAQPEPIPTPIATPAPNPKAGGVSERYLPKSVVAAPIALPLTALPQTADHAAQDGFLAIAMMMTAALVCATIDWENSPQYAEESGTPEEPDSSDWTLDFATAVDWDEELE